VILWRIATETRKYAATDLSGSGAALNPGRWNDLGQPALYTAPSIAIAVLETAAHVDTGGLPLNRFLVEIEVPDDAWAARESLDVKRLPPEWAAIPAGKASVSTGSAWIDSARTLILVVPSVFVPEESATVVNPAHAAAGKMKARVVRAFEYDKLFRRSV
jgi:RES domain-containing protein